MVSQYYDPRQLKATAPAPVAPAPKPTLTGFSLSPTSSRTRPPASPPIAPQQPREGDPSPTLGAAGYVWISGNGPNARWATPTGEIVTQDEAVAQLASLSAPFDARLRAAGYVPVPGRPGVYFNPATGDSVNTVGQMGGGGASAPVERFSHEVIGGRVFRFGDMGSPPVDTGITAPGFSNVAVDDGGNLTGIDAQGNFKVIQPGYGFAKIDPAKTFAEQVRQFDVGESNVMARSAAEREAANQRALLGAQTAGFQTVANLTPQLATAALNQAQFQRDVISSPADLAYRMFSTRGGTSPFPRVTQADLINNLASEIERYNQVLQAFRPGPVGFQPAPQVVPQTPVPTGFVAPPQAAPSFVADGGSVAPVGGISPLTRPGTPSFVTGGQLETEPRAMNMTEPYSPVEPGTNPLDRPGTPAWVREAAGLPPQVPKQTGFSVAPPTFQIPQIPVPQRTTQSEIRGFEQQTRPPAVQSILEGRMPQPLDLGFSLPTPQMYGSLTPDERKAFGSTLAIQYDLSPDDFETAVKQRFARPQERRAQVVGF